MKQISLAKFDLNLLRVFDALLVAGSVSGAAQRVGLSQPATSAALARLREALGDALLVRVGNRMRATPLAEELHPRVARMLEDIGNVLGSLARFDAASSTRCFRIGANDYVSAALLAPIARRLHELAPRAALEILPSDSGPEEALTERRVDLVIADRWILRGVANTERLFHEEFVCIARSRHPRLSRRPTLAEFVAAEHALISARGFVPGVVDAALERIGHVRRIALALPHYLVAPQIVAATDLVMTLPRRVLAHCGSIQNLRTFAPPLEIPGFEVVMATDRRSQRDPAIVWLMGLVRAASLD